MFVVETGEGRLTPKTQRGGDACSAELDKRYLASDSTRDGPPEAQIGQDQCRPEVYSAVQARTWY